MGVVLQRNLLCGLLVISLTCPCGIRRGPTVDLSLDSPLEFLQFVREFVVNHRSLYEGDAFVITGFIGWFCACLMLCIADGLDIARRRSVNQFQSNIHTPLGNNEANP